jgi:hypothetical protein
MGTDGEQPINGSCNREEFNVFCRPLEIAEKKSHAELTNPAE